MLIVIVLLLLYDQYNYNNLLFLFLISSENIIRITVYTFCYKFSILKKIWILYWLKYKKPHEKNWFNPDVFTLKTNWCCRSALE